MNNAPKFVSLNESGLGCALTVLLVSLLLGAVGLGWVVNGVFDVDYTVALTIIWSSIAIRFLIQLLMHPAILPLRQKIDAKYPKPFAAYR